MNIKTKSNFLEKKKQERKKTEDQILSKNKALLLQKNIRSFLVRKRIICEALNNNDVPFLIFMGYDVSNVAFQDVDSFIHNIVLKLPNNVELAKKFILNGMKSRDQRVINLVMKTANFMMPNLHSFLADKQFVQNLSNLLHEGRGVQFLEISWADVQQGNFSDKIKSQDLFQSVVSSLNQSEMLEQRHQNKKCSNQTCLKILCEIQGRGQRINTNFNLVSDLLFVFLSQSERQTLQRHINGLTFLLQLLKDSLKNMFMQIVEEWTQKNKHLLGLVDDEEQLHYVQNIFKSQFMYEDFCEKTLPIHERIFIKYSKTINALIEANAKFQDSVIALANQLNFIYEERKILFVYSFLSNDLSIKQMSIEKKSEFFNSLNMRLLTLDDEDFKQYQLFSPAEWRQIIQVAISRAFEIVKKSLVIGSKKVAIGKNVALFSRQNDEENQVKMLSNLLTNLNKKSLRTSKIDKNFFINEDLDNYLNTFQFGIGAKAMQIMLKNFPFVFKFQSRLRKMKEFIKADKLNHDRTLFLQEQVDQDLIIEVRRGHQFLDAYQSCSKKDLRKKYKIIFFNEQGLEQEGIDGGGIIKEFINRVLKSSFSSVYGMFYETDQHEILPNPDSKFEQEYQFVGKIVGKAVYQGINIEQKFAEPFLNLLIGKKNTFQDLQFIDKQIYKSMVDIKKMSKQDLQSLEQTFTVLDQSPSGFQRYVNLKNLSGENHKGGEILLTNQNKMDFVLSYADYKCNRQLQEKTRLFRKGFLTVMKSEWLTMFSNQQLNLIISGNNPNYSVIELKNSVVYNGYFEKSQTIIDLWSVLSEFNPEQKSAFLLFVTSCSRPPTMGFASMKPLICIQRTQDVTFLPTANTCMNVLRLPDYKNKQVLKQKLLYAINAKAGFQFA